MPCSTNFGDSSHEVMLHPRPCAVSKTNSGPFSGPSTIHWLIQYFLLFFSRRCQHPISKCRDASHVCLLLMAHHIEGILEISTSSNGAISRPASISGFANTLLPNATPCPCSSLQHHSRVTENRTVIHVNAFDVVMTSELLPIFTRSIM